MTCIVGLVENGNVWMGADGLAVAGHYYQIALAAKKVTVKKDFIIGVSGSARLSNLVQHVFTPPTHYSETDVYEYMVASFVTELRKCLTDNGALWKEKNIEGTDYSSILVGYKGRLFAVYSDFQVTESLTPYLAIGAGRDFALGSMHTSQGTPEERITQALQAAEQFCPSVGQPFTILSLSGCV